MTIKADIPGKSIETFLNALVEVSLTSAQGRGLWRRACKLNPLHLQDIEGMSERFIFNSTSLPHHTSVPWLIAQKEKCCVCDSSSNWGECLKLLIWVWKGIGHMLTRKGRLKISFIADSPCSDPPCYFSDTSLLTSQERVKQTSVWAWRSSSQKQSP